MNDLNEKQIEAVKSTEGYIRVIAGAGSGKTRTLAYRFAYLVNEIGIPASNIMCVTFTNKAAMEMKKRIRKLTSDIDMGYINTFHGFCVSVLKEDYNYINYPKSFMILDNEDTNSILKDIFDELKISSRDITFVKALDYIRACKNVIHPDYYLYLIDTDNKALIDLYSTETNLTEKIFWMYVYSQKKIFAFDFNDLILITLYILQQNEEVKIKWQKRLEYIMVDEFQDIDLHQYDLVNILCGYHNNLFVVGDPDQTIYSWRGANISFINNFDKNFPKTKTIILDQNYRSSSDILNVSNSLIEKNKNRIPKTLTSVIGNNTPVIYNHAKTHILEADWIYQKIQSLLEAGNKLSDIAILYRAHYLSRPIEEKFIENNVNYRLYSGIQFYCRKEIKDILSYMRMIVFKDDLSFQRIVNEPKRNIGKAKMQILKEYAEQNSCSLYTALYKNAETEQFKMSDAKKFIDLIEYYSSNYQSLSLSEIVAKLLNDSGYEESIRTNGDQDRLDNLAEFEFSIYDFETSFGEDVSLDEYLSRIALFTNTDLSSSQDTVKMMTIHSAKGLEFPYVFICGMNEGVFPSKKIKNLDEMEEERRLAYVGFTRAEKALFISDSEGQNFDGSFRYPSRFIFNINRDYLIYTTELDEELLDFSTAEIAKSERVLNFHIDDLPFSKSEKVIHKIFGVGEIVDIDKERGCYVIKFENGKIRHMMFNAKLEKG